MRMRHRPFWNLAAQLPKPLSRCRTLRIGRRRATRIGLSAWPESTPHALGDQRVFGQQVHAPACSCLVLAVLADAHVAVPTPRTEPSYYRHIGARKSQIDLHNQRLGLLAEPAAETPRLTM